MNNNMNCNTKNDLVSIIMLSKNKGQYVKETVRSVLAQTYENWEILFMDDSSKDDTISKMMDFINDRRIHVSKNVMSRGSGVSMKSALRQARGRWIAFLNSGDVWAPEKLEKQIKFMERNNYAFTYTKFCFIDKSSQSLGIVMSGLDRVNHQNLMKCCWMGYLTVMYDAEKIRSLRVRNLCDSNDFALWLDVSEKADCYLLNECLARKRTFHHIMSPFPIFDKIKWRYEVFRKVEDLNPFFSAWWTVRNLYGGIMKKVRYVKRINE